MKTIFFQPIITHYRESLIKSILHLIPDAHFYGASEYLTNKPIQNHNNNVHNILSAHCFNLFGHRFYYFTGGLKILFKNWNNRIVITGYDPHMLHLYLYIFILKICNKQFYWWSHANYGNQGKLGILVRKIFYNLSRRIIVYSQDGKKRLMDLGIKENKIFVANNCLNFSDYGFLKYSKSMILSKKGDVLNLIITGKLNKEKRIDILLEAIKYLITEDFYLKCSIIGDGREYKNLKTLTEDLGIGDYVEFTGELFGEEVHPYLIKADIFILPGAVGLSILHAFSFGLPIICTDKMDIHRPEIELLEIGRNGDTFNQFNHVSLAQKILKWTEKIKTEREIIFDNCIGSIEKHGYMPHNVAQNIFNALSH